jgi:hypothetical protein
MKLIRFEHANRGPHVGVLVDRGIAPIEAINAKHGLHIPDDLLAIIQLGVMPEWSHVASVETIPLERVKPLLPYDVPPKIWCIESTTAVTPRIFKPCSRKNRVVS